MEQRRLGTSGLDVPVVGMGTWKTFDVRGAAAERRRHQVVDVALESGITLFDSSPMYGEAERVLGDALRGRRDRAIVATKVWTPDDREAEAQFRRALGYYDGWVDVYQVHNLVAWRTRLDQLERFGDEGKVRSIGATHYAHSALPELMDIMCTGRITSIQVPYNPLDREVEREVLPLAAGLGLGVLIMRPVGQGTLAKARVPVEQLDPLAPFGIRTWAQALLKWLLSDPRVTTAIPATANPDHARENAAAGDPPWFGPAERDYVVRLAQQYAG
ncbi:MAG: aldo/keto reductase [Chloroflexi bacterium]|nr:aldo/keto reductase [Chloroflexota bacterium]